MHLNKILEQIKRHQSPTEAIDKLATALEKAVEGMENEDGTKGPHWTVEETTSVANQMGINLKSEKHNKCVNAEC